MQLDYELLLREGTNEEREERLRILIDIIPVGIVIIDQNHQVIETNQYFADMLGYKKHEMLSLFSWDWVVDMSEKDIRNAFSEMTTVKTSFNSLHKRKDGSLYEAEVTIAGTRINGKNMVICICSDISKRVAAERQMQYLSLHDQLTGLPNRTMFEKRIQEFLHNPHYPVSMISCDMDYLKLINDTQGHLNGDMQLIQAAKILRAAAGSRGTAARLGGDEFVIFLPGTGYDDTRIIVRKIMQGIRKYNQNQNADLEIPLLMSVGCASSNENENMTIKDIWDLYGQADLKMLRFKKLAKRLFEKKIGSEVNNTSAADSRLIK